jgi:hypothetical protein
VSILDHEVGIGNDPHDYDYSGGSNVIGIIAGRHEREPYRTEPTSHDAAPGRFELDPEETDVNTQAACRSEQVRLRGLVPGASVNVRREVGSFGSELGDSEFSEWVVIVGVGKVNGSCRADVATTTLRDACDAALADYRAKSLDAVAASSAEGRAA